MKQRLLSLLLALALAVSLTPAALAAEPDGLPKRGQTLHGFRVTDRGTLSVLDCPTVTLEHEKSGATVYYIAREDGNRTFDISFHTPAVDDKGIPHIFEHITVSGSEHYPAQNIFFPAAYQTYNTFVNAMTDETFTTFPVSSLSEDQLFALMDLYLDGVFHPLVYTEPRLFQREGWRYDLQSADAPITITGTVYNEMKGAIDISRAAGYNLQRTLYPGSIIGSNSGGDPAVIPTLTYEELLEFHRTYYHPSNALVVLYGELDLDRFLAAMDEGYFSHYDRRDTAVPDGSIAPLTAPVSGRFEFPVEAGSGTAKGAVIGYGFVANGASRKDLCGLNLLTDLLASDGSPVKEEVEAALPGASLSSAIDLNFSQAALAFIASGVNEGDAAAFQAAVDRGIARFVREGAGEDQVLGAVSAAQFFLRSLTESSQIGPSLASMIAKRWAAEGTLDYLNFYTKTLEELRSQAGSGYLEDLARRYLIQNPHRGTAVTVPVPGLKEEQEAALAQELAEKKAAMTEAEIAALVQETKDFAAWSAQEAPRELVDRLKVLEVQDLPEELVDYPITDRTEGGVRYLTAETPATGLQLTALELSLASLPTGDLPWAALYASLLGKLDTDAHTAGEIAALEARYLHNFSAAPSTLPRDARHSDPTIMVQWIAMEEEYQAGLDLAGEVLFRTDLSDTDALRSLTAQLCQSWKARLSAYPGDVQSTRTLALLAPDKYAAYDAMAGLPYYEFLCGVQDQLAADPQAVSAKLAEIQAALTTRTNAVSLYAGSRDSMAAQSKAIRAFWNALPETGGTPADRSDLPLPGRSEAVVVDAAVQYNLVAASLEELGLEPSGKLTVLAGLVSDQYLTPQMRHVVGAYGADAVFSEDGLMLTTFRDPSLREAYQAFEQTGAAVSALKLTQSDVDGYIMSAYSGAARPRGNLTGAANAMLYHLMGKSTGDRVEELREMKAVTPADVKAIGAALTRLARSGARSTFGGAAAVEGARDLFGTVLTVNRAPAEAPLTRGEALALLYGGAADALEQARAAGVIQGTGSGDPETGAPLTREALAVLLHRLAGGPAAPEGLSFADQDTVSPWALEAVRWAVSAGCMDLDETGSFLPQGPVTAGSLPAA